MDNLFVLYHYLVRSQHRTDESNAYNVALRAMHDLLETIREMDYSAEHVREHGGFDWDRANRIVDLLMTGFETGLLNHHNGARDAVVAMIEKYLPITDYDHVIARMGKLREAHARNIEELGEIDEHPF